MVCSVARSIWSGVITFGWSASRETVPLHRTRTLVSLAATSLTTAASSSCGLRAGDVEGERRVKAFLRSAGPVRRNHERTWKAALPGKETSSCRPSSRPVTSTRSTTTRATTGADETGVSRTRYCSRCSKEDRDWRAASPSATKRAVRAAADGRHAAARDAALPDAIREREMTAAHSGHDASRRRGLPWSTHWLSRLNPPSTRITTASVARADRSQTEGRKWWCLRVHRRTVSDLMRRYARVSRRPSSARVAATTSPSCGEEARAQRQGKSAARPPPQRPPDTVGHAASLPEEDCFPRIPSRNPLTESRSARAA